MRIMITGATGQLGGLIIDHLLQKLPAGSLVAGVRNLSKAARLRQSDIEIRHTDYDLPESLETSFAGISRLLFISSPHQEDAVRLLQHKRVIEAAGRAGVEHILYTGFAFSHQGSPDNIHTLTEQAILDSGMKYTFLRNALYMDFVSVIGLNEAVSSGVLNTPPGNWRFNAVTRSDLAVAAAEITANDGHENTSYELTAPHAWTFADLAQALTELSGKPVIHREKPGIQHWIYNWLSAINTASTSADLERGMGRPAASLKESVAPFIRCQQA
ncbi:NmrA family transcriptional regulator [Paenibacillus sp. FSL R7-0273]|uniref:SDR family oxidoreductase n=1 Tax=Paenibacillus sp. FSL R7-0273 TaxID=1536772 RepID=UPI0004F90E34|nr:SDR family oxidoreductase [Paenibacillus sp. FSL R7-0273]AIQ47080.1 NmrA family transcriptional regulator [Paenibacillus sp. FSL R7-0273]OMF97165.1 NAD(P)-dependent oxidoreductase [Paenibacillus sp. FSL R7-0273]